MTKQSYIPIELGIVDNKVMAIGYSEDYKVDKWIKVNAFDVSSILSIYLGKNRDMRLKKSRKWLNYDIVEVKAQ